MLYAAYKTAEGVTASRIFDTWPEYHAATFSPETEVKTLIPFEVRGATYQERKSNVEETAQRFQTEEAPGLTWGELAAICDWFSEQGKKYGLLREFYDNGVI